MKLYLISGLLTLVLGPAACGGGSSPSDPLSPSNGAPTDPSSPSGNTTTPGGSSSTPTDGGGAGDASAPAGDPTQNGPYAIAELDATTKVSATGDDVPIHCAYPTGAGGPFPVVVFAHGFQIASSLYYGYIRRLASFGYVALTADYPASFTSVSNVRDAQNVSGALDWAASAPQLAGKADTQKSGVMGHSRGGKAAVLAAARDARFKAVLGLDPVDSKPPLGCDAQTECPDSRDALAAVSIPSAFLGEITDSTGGTLGQACAPADGNYTTYYAKAQSPSVQVTIMGANHVSFVDDPEACGVTCAFCKAATAKQADVLGLAYAMSVAFFERHLRGASGYQTYLDGPKVQALWASAGLAAIQSK